MTPEIKVVQYHWGEHNRSYQSCRKINDMYCHRHWYEYVVKTFPPRDDRACRWSKIPAIREELHDCDFLLYLDADTFFYSHELRIEQELIPLLNDKKIMMCADCANEEGRIQPNKPNTVVIFVRNTPKSTEIFRIWDETNEHPGMEELCFHDSGEQETCCQTVWQEYAEDVQLLKDYYLMSGIYGMFVRHLTGMKDDDRLECLTKFMEIRRGIFHH